MSKIKSAIVCQNQDVIKYVFSPEQLEYLRTVTDLFPVCISSENFDTLDLSEIEVIFSSWGMMCFSDEQISKMPKLKAVFYAAGATDYFARPLLAHGIKVSSAWRANAIPVAEFAAAQIILSLKNYFSHSSGLTSRALWKTDNVGPGCYGETVALIGAGAISTLIQKMLQNYSLKVIVVPSRPEKRTISLEEAFRTAYVISNHLPNRNDNKKVITKEMFASMRHGATFINTGRGAQVDENGMIEVFQNRPDLTALLDVTDPEPPDENSALYQLPNIHLSAHIAGSMNDEVHRMADYAIADFDRYSKGEALQNEVTEELLMTH